MRASSSGGSCSASSLLKATSALYSISSRWRVSNDSHSSSVVGSGRSPIQRAICSLANCSMAAARRVASHPLVMTVYAAVSSDSMPSRALASTSWSFSGVVTSAIMRRFISTMSASLPASATADPSASVASVTMAFRAAASSSIKARICSARICAARAPSICSATVRIALTCSPSSALAASYAAVKSARMRSSTSDRDVS
mmetsp:Transcript_31011/g.95794  ORF Transcript_31011/g.95794 Transcript_31011/m.95794 type:complete len:200 (+) Transcript_31011:531-1130(+)